MSLPRILLVAPCVAPLGYGAAGGVTYCVGELVAALAALGADIDLMAPEGSAVPAPARPILVAGAAQPSLGADAGGAAWPAVPEGATAAMWRRVLAQAQAYDVVLNLQHDWLGYFLDAALGARLVHLPNMIGVNEATDAEIARLARAHPDRVAFFSPAQAAAYGAGAGAPLVHLSLDLAAYPFVASPEDHLAWAGRISRVKGLALAAAGAALAGMKLKAAGFLEDGAHLAELQALYPGTVDYVGFLGRDALAAHLGRARAVLQTQSWSEAFGIVTLEALAVGTPVIAVSKGANRDLIVRGRTGLLLDEETPEAVAAAIGRIGSLSRPAARAFVAENYSRARMRADLARWLAPRLAEAARPVWNAGAR